MPAEDNHGVTSAWRRFGEARPPGQGPYLFKAPFDGLVRIGGRRRFGWGIGWALGEDPVERRPGVFKTDDELGDWLWAEIPG